MVTLFLDWRLKAKKETRTQRKYKRSRHLIIIHTPHSELYRASVLEAWCLTCPTPHIQDLVLIKLCNSSNNFFLCLFLTNHNNNLFQTVARKSSGLGRLKSPPDLWTNVTKPNKWKRYLRHCDQTSTLCHECDKDDIYGALWGIRLGNRLVAVAVEGP